MPTHIADEQVAAELIEARQAYGQDRQDEVWEGTYVIMPLGNEEHQGVATRLASILDHAVAYAAGDRIYAGLNVTDVVPPDDWRRNFRCPDVAVYLSGNPRVRNGAATVGGPDLAVEIVSPGDRSREKFDFYAAVGTQELLVVDRDPWSLELYRLEDDVLTSVARGARVTTQSVPAVWQIAEGGGGDTPLALTCGGREWAV